MPNVEASAAVDPGSLDRLHDLVELPPASWWPPAPGWYVAGAAAIVLCGWAGGGIFARRRRNRYRRAALKELSAIAHLRTSSGAVVPAVAELLKRTALAAFHREQVAALTGEAWLQFLDRTGGGKAFTHGPGRVLGESQYRPTAAVDATVATQLVAAARHWIVHHRC